MNSLVIFYSRTGTTKKAAETIVNTLRCDIEEIFDTKDRSGAMGYLMAGRDTTLGKSTTIKPTVKDPIQYDLVIIGTPVWVYNMSLPIRAYLGQNKEKLRKVAFFCAMGGDGDKRTFAEMEKLCGQKPLATMTLLTKEAMKNEVTEKIKQFIDKLK